MDSSLPGVPGADQHGGGGNAVRDYWRLVSSEDIQSGWVENTDMRSYLWAGIGSICTSAPLRWQHLPISDQRVTAPTRTGKAYVSAWRRADGESDHCPFSAYLSSKIRLWRLCGRYRREGWAGKGGLMTDAHWFELWIWTRINRWLLRGNTYGYTASNHIPQWHLDANDIGILDNYLGVFYGAS